jgi:predicted transcriptional regulator
LLQDGVVASVDQTARKSGSGESVRQSVSLPSRIANRVRALAETRHTTASRVLVDLIETGLQTKQAQHDRFFELTDQLAEAKDPAERKRLQEELARISCCK